MVAGRDYAGYRWNCVQLQTTLLLLNKLYYVNCRLSAKRNNNLLYFNDHIIKSYFSEQFLSQPSLWIIHDSLCLNTFHVEKNGLLAFCSLTLELIQTKDMNYRIWYLILLLNHRITLLCVYRFYIKEFLCTECYFYKFFYA